MLLILVYIVSVLIGIHCGALNPDGIFTYGNVPTQKPTVTCPPLKVNFSFFSFELHTTYEFLNSMYTVEPIN